MVMHNKTKTMAISLASILFLAILIVPSVYADESIVDVVTIDVPVSCSMSATGNTSHNATVQNGATVSDIGTTNIKVICNDNSGYAIYAIGYTDDTYGKTVLTSSTLGSTHDIITSSTVTTGTSSWAMKLAATSGTYAPTVVTDYASYHAVPQEYTKVAYLASSTDTGNNATGSNLTTTYRTYISQTQPAGTYVGQVKYTLVHPNMTDDSNKPVAPLADNDCEAGYVCYGPNASDVDGSMSSLGAISGSSKAGKINVGISAAEITLIAPNYSRPGYGFAGWSTDFEATSSSKIYGPNETITVANLPTDEEVTFSSQGLILYPVWIASTGNLQGADGNGWTGCSSLTAATYNSTTGKVEATLASMTALTDTRDNNVYAVARLADGKCWMVENLRLNAEDSRGTDNIAKAQGYGDATANNQGKFIGLADSEDANFTASSSSATEPTTANSIYYAGTQSGTATINIFQTNYAGFRMPRYNNNNTNMATGATNSDGSTTLTDSYNGSGNNRRWYGYGNYYSWAAAIANTKYYDTYSGTNGSDAAGTSICPKGWKLPLGVQSLGTINGVLQDEANDSANRVGGFSYLDRKLGGTGGYQSGGTGTTQSKKWRSFPNNFVYSGIFGDSSAYGRSSDGHYWSSSTNANYHSALFLKLNSSLVNSSNSDNKNIGRSARCIAQ